MGYNVDIIECNLTVKEGMLEKAKEVLESFGMDGIFGIDGDEITPTDWCFKWTGEEYLFLAALSKVAEGYVAFRGEDDTYWKIELRDGRVIGYTGEVVYQMAGEVTIPEDVLREGVIVNKKYVAAILENSKILVYNREAEEWLERLFYGSLDDLRLIEDVIIARDVRERYQFSSPGKPGKPHKPDPETLREFARKVLKHPGLGQDVKLALARELI